MYKRIQTKLRNKSVAAYYRYYPTICSFRDKRTHRKVLVIESDDWGSIRVPSIEAKCALIKRGYEMDAHPFERCDTLESNDDLEALLDVLSDFKDSQGNHPIMTANALVCNPDFDKIKASDFLSYSYESVSRTYMSYPNSNRVLALMKEGADMGCFCPQSHGREHFNFMRWLRLLRSGDEDALTAFEYNMCGIFSKTDSRAGNDLMKAFKYANEDDKVAVLHGVAEGLDLFKDQFGYVSETFVAPCYWWSGPIEEVLFRNGVRMIQTERAWGDCERNKIAYHYSGERNRYHQVYSIRNCSFEPAINRNGEEAERCLNQIAQAFESNKIAVVSSHRINYVGGIIPENRDMTLVGLRRLLDSVIKRFPDVEFMSSSMMRSQLFENV